MPLKTISSFILILYSQTKLFAFSFFVFLIEITLIFFLKHYKTLGSLLTSKNSIHEEIKCRLKEGNSCYYSVQTFLTSILLSKNLKIKIYKIIILPVVLYGYETWSLSLRKECWIRYLKTGTRDQYLGPRGIRMVSGKGSTTRDFIVCTVHLI